MRKFFALVALAIPCVSYAQPALVDLSCTERVASPGTSTSFVLRSDISITADVLTKQVIQAGQYSGSPLVMKFDSEDGSGGILFVSDYQDGIAIGVHRSNLIDTTVGQQMYLYQMQVIKNRLDSKTSRLDCKVTRIR